MMSKSSELLCLFIVASLISILSGCASQRTNHQFTVSVSGDTGGLIFDGQCTTQKARLWPGESVADGLTVEGTVHSVDQPQEYAISGYFVYCAVANQSSTGTITVELLKDGGVVASAQSSSPDEPAIIEFGEKP
jgi:hypothetical protein